jgi:radical SAM superfamily enzyme YgiQ (UPF0313 family)
LQPILRNSGYEVDILDINGHRWDSKEVEKRIAASEYDLYGIGGLITTYSYIRRLTTIIRTHHPSKPIICGGPLTTASPSILLKCVDAVVVGEGECSIIEAVKDAEQGRLKKIYRSEPLADLDKLPFPNYDALDTLPTYLHAAVGAHNPRKWQDGKPIEKVKTLPLLSGRGCPFNCYFCSSHYLGPGYRVRSPLKIAEEAAGLIDRYDVQYFHFMDELTTLRVSHEFSKLDVTWGCPARIDVLNHKDMQEMKDAGCIHIGTGIESFSPRVLKAMNKLLNVKNAKANLKLAKEMGFDIQYTLILGYPGENKETIAETVEGVKDVGFPPEQVFFPVPYPITELYKYACSGGFIKNEEEYLLKLSSHEQRDFLFNFTGLSDEELLDARRKILNVE